jgi:hypothetical protein
LNELKIIEVAYGGLAAATGMIWLRVRLRVSMLGIEIRNSLNFFWIFFFGFGCYWYSRRY